MEQTTKDSSNANPRPTLSSALIMDTATSISASEAGAGARASNNSTVVIPSPASITTLPVELCEAVLKYLDPVASTCLGLTCKKLYPIHRRLQGTVSLSTEAPQPTNFRFNLLGFHISTWAGKDLVFAFDVRPPPLLPRRRRRGNPLAPKPKDEGRELKIIFQRKEDWIEDMIERNSIYGVQTEEQLKEWCVINHEKHPDHVGWELFWYHPAY